MPTAAPAPTPAPTPASTAASPSDSPNPNPAPSPSPAPAAARPDYLPEEYWDAEKASPKVDALAGKLKELTAAQQAELDRKAALPKSADDYVIDLPADFKAKLPDGWQIDTADPAWKPFAAYAQERGLSQEDFAKGAQLITEMRLGEQARRIDAANAEFAKLGDQGKAMVEGVHRFIDANAGSPEAAAAVKASLVNSETVKFYTNVVKAMTSNGITAFNGSGREASGRADGKPQNWDSMSPIDRLTWIRSNQNAA